MAIYNGKGFPLNLALVVFFFVIILFYLPFGILVKERRYFQPLKSRDFRSLLFLSLLSFLFSVSVIVEWSFFSKHLFAFWIIFVELFLWMSISAVYLIRLLDFLIAQKNQGRIDQMDVTWINKVANALKTPFWNIFAFVLFLIIFFSPVAALTLWRKDVLFVSVKNTNAVPFEIFLFTFISLFLLLYGVGVIMIRFCAN
ncbi:hypothetical protein MHBO_001160 [Bonamia ostreae]|uniref:Uncharacterized protein n=1 Tax=Bonamia ostreae TaxID=126728 RepID=A0ABV2AI10_9EUKA